MTRGNKAHELHLQMKLHMDNEKTLRQLIKDVAMYSGKTTATNQRRSNVFWHNLPLCKEVCYFRNRKTVSFLCMISLLLSKVFNVLGLVIWMR